MPLTPADIHNTVFSKSSITKRGYDEEDVDSLLDAVTGEMIQLLEENEVLRDRVRLGDATAVTTVMKRPEVNELAAAREELSRARREYERAGQLARSLRERLEDARRATPVEAPPVDPRVLAMAERTAEHQMNDAYQGADEVLVDSRERSRRITEEGRQAAREIMEESRRRYDGAITATQSSRAALLQEIGELTDFAGQYRAALEGHIRHQEQMTGS